MKRLDDSTIEAIAEAICGQGEGAGGGYTAPGPYRTKTQICDFFRRAGVDPQGMSRHAAREKSIRPGRPSTPASKAETP